jgi:azurin
VSQLPGPARPLLRAALLLLVAATAVRAADGADAPLRIAAVTGLQYSVKRFAVAPGAHVDIEFANEDTTDMPHNLVITRPGKRLDVVNAALALGADAERLGFVPKMPEVLFALTAVKPHKSARLSFTAPAEAGIYPYVCTFPGHGFVMFGDMYVGVPMPAEAPVVEEKEASAHAFPTPRPYLYRMFMPDSGPASLAIALPGDLNCCWDAGECRLRYVWTGGFVDNHAYWKGNGNGKAKVLGTRTFTAAAGAPLRFSTGAEPKVRFRGYALVQGYPEFQYELDGATVAETLREADGGKALIQSYVVTTDKPLLYVVAKDAAARFSSSAGAFADGVLRVAPAAGKAAFSVTLRAGAEANP